MCADAGHEGGGVGTDLKVSYGAAGLIRSLAVGRDGSQLVVVHSYVGSQDRAAHDRVQSSQW